MKFFKHIGYASFLFILPVVAFAQTGLINPIQANNVCQALKLILDTALGFVMPFLMLAVVYAGFRLVFARGNPKALVTAKRQLFYVIVGVVAILGIWVGGQIVANIIAGVATPGGNPNISGNGSCTI